MVSGSFDVRAWPTWSSSGREDEIESTTVGGLISEWLGRVPRIGETVERQGIRIDVLAGDERRVEQVRIAKSQTVNHE